MSVSKRHKRNDYIVFDNNVLNVLFGCMDRRQVLECRLVCKKWNKIGLMWVSSLSLNSALISNEMLKTFKYVRSLKLCGNRIITDDGLKHLKKLTSLNLYVNDRITDDGLKHLKKLVKVNE